MFGSDWDGAGVLVYDFPLSMFVASGRVVPILCVGFCVRMFGSRLWLGYCGCVSHLFVLVLLSLLLGILLGCIWDGVGVG